MQTIKHVTVLAQILLKGQEFSLPLHVRAFFLQRTGSATGESWGLYASCSLMNDWAFQGFSSLWNVPNNSLEQLHKSFLAPFSNMFKMLYYEHEACHSMFYSIFLTGLARYQLLELGLSSMKTSGHLQTAGLLIGLLLHCDYYTCMKSTTAPLEECVGVFGKEVSTFTTY